MTIPGMFRLKRRAPAAPCLARCLVVGLALHCSRPEPLATQQLHRIDSRTAAELRQRTDGFLATVRRQRPDSIAEYFPAQGDFVWYNTSHVPGWEHVGVWRFPAEQALEAIRRGPLLPSFDLNPHAQPIGLFTHQLILRGSNWRRVGRSRFVPPGAPASSPTFVEWRREGDRWVISSFGDELFAPPFPSWCC